jgi:hypothetical protein
MTVNHFPPGPFPARATTQTGRNDRVELERAPDPLALKGFTICGRLVSFSCRIMPRLLQRAGSALFLRQPRSAGPFHQRRPASNGALIKA